MKKEKLQQTPQKYKGSQNEQLYANKNGQPRRNEQILRKVQSPKTEQGRNRKYEQANYQE